MSTGFEEVFFGKDAFLKRRKDAFLKRRKRVDFFFRSFFYNHERVFIFISPFSRRRDERIFVEFAKIKKNLCSGGGGGKRENDLQKQYKKNKKEEKEKKEKLCVFNVGVGLLA